MNILVLGVKVAKENLVPSLLPDKVNSSNVDTWLGHLYEPQERASVLIVTIQIAGRSQSDAFYYVPDTDCWYQWQPATLPLNQHILGIDRSGRIVSGDKAVEPLIENYLFLAPCLPETVTKACQAQAKTLRQEALKRAADKAKEAAVQQANELIAAATELVTQAHLLMAAAA